MKQQGTKWPTHIRMGRGCCRSMEETLKAIREARAIRDAKKAGKKGGKK